MVQPIPEGYRSVTPYVLVQGAAKFLAFAEKAFGAKVLERYNQPDGSVMHALLQLGDSRVMLAEPQPPNPSRPAAFYYYVPDTDATYRAALDAGATSLQAPSNQFYGDRNAGVQDPAGNVWWIATHVEDVSGEELARRTAEHAKQKPKPRKAVRKKIRR